MTTPTASAPDQDQAFIPASTHLPEITIKAVILGVLLALILAASNAYLGLKAGTTISASIPAAVISMGILRFFKRSNVLENNIVQTAASAGEALVAGMIYIIPALLVLTYWSSFHYLDCVIIAIIGGVTGVLCSIPIRRILLSNPQLPFPEGVAVGNVLKASADSSVGLKYLVNGGLVGGGISFIQSGLKLLSENFAQWTMVGGNVMGFGLGFSPALVAAGYIVGINVGMSILIGVLIGSVICIPILSHWHGFVGIPQSFVDGVGHTDIRYIGLGVMLLGGLLTLIQLAKPFYQGLKAMFLARKNKAALGQVLRTERDLSSKAVFWLSLVTFVAMFFLFRHHLHSAIPLDFWHGALVLFFCIVFAIIASFIFSCLCGYFTGLVGSSNNPLSAMMLGTVIIGSFLMILCLGKDYFQHGASHLAAAAMVVILASVVSCASAITTDTIQDLKAGQMVGATPWKQQVMLIVGVVASALVIPLILKLLFNAYGMAGMYPRLGMDPSQMLNAPQAAMMALVVQAVFDHHLPWNLLMSGFGITIACVIANFFLKSRGKHIIILAVGLGIYLPLDATTPMVMGGVMAALVGTFWRKAEKTAGSETEAFKVTRSKTQQRAMMLACGLVAGSTLMGVILAVPFALSQSTDVLALVSSRFNSMAIALSFVVTLVMLYWLYRTACHTDKKA